MMKLVIFAFLAAIVVSIEAQADRYPAGLNPALCPNYPDCDNSLIALHSARAAIAPTYDSRYPAGVHPAACPNYPYCNNNIAAPYVHSGRAYPAGVHPAACPNYPYC